MTYRSMTEDLNPMQEEAVLHGDGPLLILAGAGSGKTRVLTHRVAYLVEERGVSPDRIIAITFTNKAAREMKERIFDLVGNVAESIWISTFHSSCVRILKRDIEKIGYTRNFSIYDGDDQLKVIKECLKELDLNEKYYNPKAMREEIGSYKDRLIKPNEIDDVDDSSGFRDNTIKQIYEAYEKKMEKNNALDFDDLINKTIDLFTLRPEILDYYSDKFKYVLVDEYQDTNYAQYKFINLLSKKHENICVVGDDDQSIYGWRGADIRNILDFEEDYPNTKVIKLEENYRSTQTILDTANHVISNNIGRKPKELWTQRGLGDKVKLYRVNDERSEAKTIISTIESHMLIENMQAGDFAVLYRTNAQSRIIEDSMLRAGLPYRIYGGLRFYDRKEIKDIVAYLKLIVNPADDISLKRIINEPRRGIGMTTVNTLEEISIRSGDNIFSIILDIENYVEELSRPKQRLISFGNMISDLVAMSQLKSLPDFIEMVIVETKYDEALIKEQTPEAQSRLENIQEFVSAAKDFEEENPDADLSQFLDNIALITDLDSQDESKPAVNLMTLHSAKGLEFPIVFMPGMEEYLLPHSRSIDSKTEMEEERRLCYVGITRAKKSLYLSYANRRTLYNRTNSNMPSRFLREIPEELLEEIDETLGSSSWAGGNAYTSSQRNRKSYSEHKVDRNLASINLDDKPEITKDLSKYKVGQRIYHTKFGEGTIVSVSGEREDPLLSIAFENKGIKNFQASYAPIKKIN